MNFTWQIIQKDLYHFRWTLAVWLGCFVYLIFFQQNAVVTADRQDFYRIFAIMLLALFSFGLLSGIVHQDHPGDSTAFWRTRPIAPVRLLVAKLLVATAFFIAFPVLAVWLKNQLGEQKSMVSLREYGLVALVLSSLTLSIMAAAACTRNTVQSLALWMSLIFVTGSLVEILSRYNPAVNWNLTEELTLTKILSLLLFSIAMALAIIANQYLRRRMPVSIALFVSAAVGPAVIGTAWSYYYFYHS